MKTIEEIKAAIESAKSKLNKAGDSTTLMAAINELNGLVWRLSIHERQPSDPVGICVIAKAPESAPENDAVNLALAYRTRTHITAWPWNETNELVLFQVDCGDLIKVLNDLDELGYSYHVEAKE